MSITENLQIFSLHFLQYSSLFSLAKYEEKCIQLIKFNIYKDDLKFINLNDDIRNKNW